MVRHLLELRRKDGFSINPPPPNMSHSFNYEKQPTATSSLNNKMKISPVILLVIIVVAAILFISGILLHLLIRVLRKKRPHFSAIYHSNRFLETSSTSHSQLQHLFRQHDAGLDQAFVDALPLFYYKDIGSTEPFDCAVCLCEFTDKDRLRLLPICRHAFHIHCIDTWLLSNSTCPLCRTTLFSSTFPNQNPSFNFQSEETKRVFSVRLGKFTSLNDQGESSRDATEEEEEEEESSSRCNLDARRCYSMGAVEYVVVSDSIFQVEFPNLNDCVSGNKIRGDSFSVSKTWLWSKNKRFPSLMDESKITVT